MAFDVCGLISFGVDTVAHPCMKIIVTGRSVSKFLSFFVLSIDLAFKIFSLYFFVFPIREAIPQKIADPGECRTPAKDRNYPCKNRRH